MSKKNTKVMLDSKFYTETEVNTLLANLDAIDDKLTTELDSKMNIANTYTKAEIEQLILGSTPANIGVLKVDKLPEVGKISVLYLVPNGTTNVGNKYDIYLWASDAWEQIDTISFNFDNYCTKDLLTTSLEAKANTVHSHVFGDITNLVTDLYANTDFIRQEALNTILADKMAQISTDYYSKANQISDDKINIQLPTSIKIISLNRISLLKIIGQQIIIKAGINNPTAKLGAIPNKNFMKPLFIMPISLNNMVNAQIKAPIIPNILIKLILSFPNVYYLLPSLILFELKIY